jgi:hypothetical protein
MQKQVGEWFDLIEYYKKIGDIYKVYPLASSMLRILPLSSTGNDNGCGEIGWYDIVSNDMI